MEYYEDNNDLTEIKERIYQEEKVEFILEELECQNVKQIRNDRFEAQLPESFDSKNKRAVQIYNNENLHGGIRNKGIKGDIFVIVSYILYGAEEFEQVLEVLYQTKAWVCNILGWDEYLNKRDSDFEEQIDRVDYLSFLRPVQKKRKQRSKKANLTEKKNKVINESVMNRYFDYAHYEFYKDGIHPKTQKFFGVMFDRDTERIVYPLHNKDGELIGVKGRYVGNDEKKLEEVKYLFLHRCDKSIELWNLHRALEHIKEAGEVIVFESAKSVMLAWQWGYKNAVSIEGNELSPVQAMLLKQLDADIIFAYDKDMNKKHIEKTAKQIKTRVCKAIYDKNDILEDKDSPVDKGKEVWGKLYHEHKYSIIIRK